MQQIYVFHIANNEAAQLLKHICVTDDASVKKLVLRLVSRLYHVVSRDQQPRGKYCSADQCYIFVHCEFKKITIILLKDLCFGFEGNEIHSYPHHMMS